MKHKSKTIRKYEIDIDSFQLVMKKHGIKGHIKEIYFDDSMLTVEIICEV